MFRRRSTAGVDGNQVRRRLTGDTPLIAAHRSPLAATGSPGIPCTSGFPVRIGTPREELYKGLSDVPIT